MLYFKIIIDPQEVAKIVQKAPLCPSPSFTQWLQVPYPGIRQRRHKGPLGLPLMIVTPTPLPSDVSKSCQPPVCFPLYNFVILRMLCKQKSTIHDLCRWAFSPLFSLTIVPQWSTQFLHVSIVYSSHSWVIFHGRAVSQSLELLTPRLFLVPGY